MFELECFNSLTAQEWLERYNIAETFCAYLKINEQV